MPYFIRRYEKGVKNSGCLDIIVSETQIPIETFVNLAHATGPGKYILGQRGKGIRGFNKITDCMVEPEEAVIIENTYTTFAAEDSISVKRLIWNRLNFCDLPCPIEKLVHLMHNFYGNFRD